MYLLPVTVDHFLPVNCEYEPMSPKLMRYYLHCRQMQILSPKRCWSLCWNESHHKETLFICTFALSSWPQTYRTLSIVTSERYQRTLNKIENLIWYCFALLLHLLEICSIDQFYVLNLLCTFILIILSSFVVCTLISLIDRFRVRKSVAGFGAFLFHI